MKKKEMMIHRIRKSKWARPSYNEDCGPYGAWNDRVDKLIEHCLTHTKDLHSQKIFRLLCIAYPEVNSKYEKSVMEREKKRQLKISSDLNGGSNLDVWGYIKALKDFGFFLPNIISNLDYATHHKMNEIFGTDPMNIELYMHPTYMNKYTLMNPGFIRNGIKSSDYVTCDVRFYKSGSKQDRVTFHLLKEDGKIKPTIKDILSYYQFYRRGTTKVKIDVIKLIEISGEISFKDEHEFDTQHNDNKRYPWKDRCSISFILK